MTLLASRPCLSTDRERAEIGPPPDEPPRAFPWKAIGANKSVWAIMGATFAYVYSNYFFLFWLPTYMIRARGFTEGETKLSALPFVLGALMAGMLILGAGLWLRTDATETLASPGSKTSQTALA